MAIYDLILFLQALVQAVVGSALWLEEFAVDALSDDEAHFYLGYKIVWFLIQKSQQLTHDASSSR